MTAEKSEKTIKSDIARVSLVSDPKVVLWFCLIGIVLILAGFFYYASELDHIRQVKASELGAIGKMKVEQIVRWRRERSSDAKRIANSPLSQKLAGEWLHDPDRLINKNELTDRLKLEAEQGVYFQALLVTADQKILLSGTSKPAEMETDSWAAVKKALTEPGPVLSELHFTTSGKIHIDIATAMRDPAGQLLAVLVLTTNAEEFLFPMIQFWPTASLSGETLLVRRDGDEVVFLNELRHRKDTALRLRFPLSLTTLPGAEAVLGKTGVFFGTDYRGSPVIADLRPVPGTDWFVVAKESESEIRGEVRFRAIIVSGAVFILVLCLAGGMALWNQTLQVEERKRVEALLRDSETRYRRLFETAKDGILILDALTGMIVDVNPFLVKILGYSHEQFCGKMIWEVGFFKDVIANKDNFLKLQREKFVRYEDLPLETANGRKIDVEFVSNVYRVDHHDVVQCNIRDITDRKRADEAVRRSAKEWGDTFDAISDAVWLLSPDSKILRTNKAAQSMLHLKAEEMVGRFCYEVVHGTDKPHPECPIARMRVSGHREFSELLLGGRWFLVTVDPILDPAGSLTGIVHVVSDINQRKWMEETNVLNVQRTQALLKLNQMTEASLKEITDFTLEAAVQLTQSKIGYLAFLNKDESVLTMHAWSKSAMAECSVSDKPILYDVKATGLWGEAVRQRRPIITNDYAAANPLKKGCPQGHVVVKRHMNTPVFDGSRIVIVAGVGNKDEEYTEGDVLQLTLLMEGMWRLLERKRLEGELAQAKESQFKTLIETLPAKVFLKDRNSVYLACNESYAKDLGIEPEEIVGKTDYDFLPTHLAVRQRDEDKRILESGKAESREEEYRPIKGYLKGSEAFFINIVKTPIRDKAGNLMGLLGLFWDITERKAAEVEKKRVEALASVVETKSRFTSMVSHELRSPLAVTKEALDILSEGMVGSVNDEQKDILRIAKGNIDRLGRLINNVLDFQKIESGKMAYNIQENDLNEVLTEVYRSMSVLSKKKGLDLRAEMENGLSKTKLDRDRIVQVLTNLMNNAINNTEKGSVILAAKKENDGVHIRVQDAGIGIPADDIPKLFQPFEQVDGNRAKKKGGTGLGLAISKEIILAHHGKIWVESEVGKGSVFHFILPL